MDTLAKSNAVSLIELRPLIADQAHYARELQVALDLELQGRVIDGALCPEPAGTIPPAESPGVSLAEVLTDLTRRYSLRVHLRGADLWNIVVVRDRITAALAPLFLPWTGLAYRASDPAPAFFIYGVDPPVSTELTPDPRGAAIPWIDVYGPESTVELPPSPLGHGQSLIYHECGKPARVDIGGFFTAITLLTNASWLVHRFPVYGSGEELALALTRYLRERRWSRASVCLYVSCIAAHAGDHDVAQAALEGHLITKATLSYDDAVDALGMFLGQEGWDYFTDSLSSDPRVNQQWRPNDTQATTPFVEMIETFDKEARVHT